MSLSLGITTHNRIVEVVRLITSAYHCPEIKEIVIVDDCSDDYEKLLNWAHFPKIKLFRNETNLGCFKNKLEVIKKCTQPHVMLIDSDNIIDSKYVKKAVENINGRDIIAPSKALPHFDYTSLIGTLDKTRLGEIIHNNTLDCCLNTCNYCLPREEFLVFMESLDVSYNCQGLDSLYIATQWLKSGRDIKIVDGMEYIHEIRPHDSVYLKTQDPLSIKNEILGFI
jgi:glycosyltransferase involved in cell wall biosynthesis